MNLPSKITEDSWFYKGNEELCKPYLGQPYISYSTKESVENYIEDFVKYKLVQLPQPVKIYAEFGKWVGSMLEHGKPPEENPFGFEGAENFDYSERVEGAEYEKMIIIPRDGFVILGFIDKWVESEGLVNDQKTGGKGKHTKYEKEEYDQTVLYSYGLELQGKEVKRNTVTFLLRIGSHINPPLKLSKEKHTIEIEYNEKRLQKALKNMDKVAKQVDSLKTTYDKFFGN